MNGHTRNRPSAKEGFTLLEVLIAMALSAVIMMALFSMFDSVVNVASGIKDKEGEAYGERIFESILFDDFRSIYASSKAEYAFSGKSGFFLGADGDLMSFCTTATLGPVGAQPVFSLQEVEYLLKGGSESKTVYRREKEYSGLTGNWEWVEVPIVKGVSDLRIEYQDTDDSFVTEWNKAGYPRAVKVEIEFGKNRGYAFLVNLSQMARDGL